MPTPNEHRAGRFRIYTEDVIAYTARIAEIFRVMKCVPVRAEALFVEAAVEYTALSDLFEPVGRGSIVPAYDIIVALDVGAAGAAEVLSVQAVRAQTGIGCLCYRVLPEATDADTP